MFQRFDGPSVAAGRPMDTVVQSPNKGIEHGLHIDAFNTLSEPRENDFPSISFAVAIRVFQVKNIGRRSDKNTTAIAKHSCWPRQVIGIDGAFVVRTIPVRVLEHADASEVRDFFAALG